MFDNFKITNYSKALVSPELFGRPLSRLLTGDVFDGLTVTPGSGLQVVLAPGNTMIRYGSAAVASARLVSLVANFNLTIGTADVSNPRIDVVVVYVDNSVSLPSGTPTSANLDGPGVAKAKIVPGTAAGSPVAPNDTAIQASVGAGNPYTVVAQVRINAGVSVIASNVITDVRSVARLAGSKIDYTAVATPTTDTNGWTITTNSWGKKVYTKKVSTSISLNAGIAFNNYTLSAVPVAVAANLTSYVLNFTALLPSGYRQVSTNFMVNNTNIELGCTNMFTGGAVNTTVWSSLIVTEV